MAWYVHFSCTFSGDSADIEKAKPIAFNFTKNKKFLDSDLGKVLYHDEPEDEFDFEEYDNPYNRETNWLIEAIVDEKNYNCGPKGEVFSYGFVGNHTRDADIAREITPFFEELLRKEIIVSSHDHIILFIEHEQSGKPIAYEFYLDNEEPNGKMILDTHKNLPFKWNQW